MHWLRRHRERNPLTLATARAYERGGAPRWPAKELVALVKRAARELFVDVDNDLLGCGVFGCAVPVKGRPLVLKVSDSGRELRLVQSVLYLSPREARGFVRIEREPVMLGPDPNRYASDFDLFANRTFAYVRERVEPMGHVHWPSFLLDAHNAAEDGRVDDYLGELDLFTEPYIEIAATMRFLYEKEDTLVRDALPTNMGWRTRGSKRTLVLMDADAYAPLEDYED